MQLALEYLLYALLAQAVAIILVWDFYFLRILVKTGQGGPFWLPGQIQKRVDEYIAQSADPEAARKIHQRMKYLMVYEIVICLGAFGLFMVLQYMQGNTVLN